MFPICETLGVPGYWLVCAVMFPREHQLGMSGTGEPEFCFCAPLFIRLLSESPISLSLSTCYISLLHPLPRLSSRLSIFPLSVLFLSGPTVSPSFCLSIFSPPGLTVWKVDESDCMWQSGMGVNLMWLIWWLLSALWKSFTVKEHWDTATL